ncbi:MAG: hypothetical protein RQ936_09840 [Gammaproteobacteria bacterium]|nr:hypothetical protein [Gammaproteobacteria bacterium]
MEEKELPELCDNPFMVMDRIHAGENIALRCEIQRCVIYNGLSMAADGWHPFVEAAKEYLRTGEAKYEGSVLERYYKKWQPVNARDALIGIKNGTSLLEKNSPLLIHNLPWIDVLPDAALAKLCRIIDLENKWAGHSELTYLDGYGLQGPVSNKKAKIEYDRLLGVVDSIQKHGYKRGGDDITVQVLKRGDNFRYLVLHGQHRVAVMAAIEQKTIPATPLLIVDSKYVEHWPQVYKGVWSREHALQYFNHLFDFDSKQWARELGLKTN